MRVRELKCECVYIVVARGLCKVEDLHVQTKLRRLLRRLPIRSQSRTAGGGLTGPGRVVVLGLRKRKNTSVDLDIVADPREQQSHNEGERLSSQGWRSAQWWLRREVARGVR
jgi:hypothetical protein